MDRWLQPALEYVRSWLEFQMRLSEQPGCIIAVAHGDRVILEQAFGHANLDKREKLTPRHRFRIASHSKSFTAAGVMKLREQRRLRLDDPVGQFVKRLHPRVAEATIGQVMSHSAGIIRDGSDAGQFSGRRPFLRHDELIADLQQPPVIEANTRFKYSNHGFGLLGLVIETITGEPYRKWIKREIVDAVGWAGYWLDGIIHILRAFAAHGPPTRRVRDWTGRWWSTWGALDLVAIGNIVLGANPHAGNPFLDATVLELTGRDSGRMWLAGGYQSHGETVRRIRNKRGAVTEVWWSASRLRPEARVAAELQRRYRTPKSSVPKEG